MVLGNRALHFVRDGTVAWVAFAAGAQLNQLHRLTRVAIEDEADPVAKAERVRRGVALAAVGKALVLGGRGFKAALVVVGNAGLLQLVRYSSAKLRP